MLVVEKRYDAARPDVWHAVTTAERIARWLAPVSGDLVLGGRYQIEGNAGGTVLRCEEPELLEITWEFGGGVTWVVVTLTEDGERHPAPRSSTPRPSTRPSRTSSGRARSASAGRWHSEGCGCTSPTRRRRGPTPTTPTRATPPSCAPRATAWAEADAAAGTDPEQARAAAERCIAAYTALPPDEGQG